jgi:sarcosine oxidase
MTMGQGSYEVIVLGLGGMGTAAAFELARRGRRVLGLEQFQPGHDRGSSHGQTRVIRKAYYEHPDYVPLLHRTYARWYDLEQRCGRHLLTECGCLSIGPPEGELVAGVRRAAAEHHLPVAYLTAADLRRRFPALRFGDDQVAVLEPQAGFLYVEDCVRAYAQEARLLGADLHEDEPALSWKATAGGVVVQTRQQTYTADRLVITAGAWAGAVLADLGLSLTVLRKVLFWFGTADDRLLRRDLFPIYMAETPTGFYYGFPVLDPAGHKVARHDGGNPVADPAAVDRTVSTAEEADCQAFLQAHLPVVDGPRRQAKVCLYTMTPDQHFLLDYHPAHPQVAIAAGFSGHGFKFAAVVGEILADFVEQGRTDLPISRFRLERFRLAG